MRRPRHKLAEPSRSPKLESRPHPADLHQGRPQRLHLPLLPYTFQHQPDLGRRRTPPLLRRWRPVPPAAMVLPPRRAVARRRPRRSETLVPTLQVDAQDSCSGLLGRAELYSAGFGDELRQLGDCGFDF